MAPADRLALEHLTAPSLSPLALVELAATLDCRAATLLVGPFAPFPQTRGVDLVGDGAARRAVRGAAEREGVAIALAYPFVLTPRRNARVLAPALEAAAGIGAAGVGLLVMDDDAARARDEAAAFCDLCAGFGMRPALEAFGGSAAPSLAAADGFEGAGLGLCVDLLHLMRAGDAIADMAATRAPIVHAQISDAPHVSAQPRDEEAAHGRLPLGAGDFDVVGFVAAAPATAWIGLEIPPPREPVEDEPARAGRLLEGARLVLRHPPEPRPAASRR